MYELEDTYHWLGSEIHSFPYTLHTLVEKSQMAARRGDFSIACQYLGEIKAGRSLADETQQALLHIECARVACRMHNRIQAEGEIKDAIAQLRKGNLDDPFIQHALAVAHWMLGNLTLPFSNTPQEITATWGKSLQIFERMASHPETFRSQRDWYLDRCAEMRQAIREAIITNPRSPALPQAHLHAGRLKSIRWVDSIPQSGLPQPVATASQDLVYLDPFTSDFRIAERAHYLYNLRGDRPLILLDSKPAYLILKVKDNRLDKIGIAPGDYVLVRQQTSAQNGDVVAATIQGKMGPATLHTYLVNEGQIGFHPQSTNPEQSIFEFSSGSDGECTIYGVVIGVFKPTMTAARPAGSAQDGRRIPSQEDLQAISFSDFLRSLPVYEKIPAGGFDKIPEKTGSILEIDRVWIEGRAYWIKNLRRADQAINLTSGEVIVLGVNGDSMNRLDIQSGDYVLLRRQGSAEDNDIAAAEISGVDQQATLKRFHRRGKKVVLQPESTNPDYKEMEFDPKDFHEDPGEGSFHIRGVALAVLKPL
jgi:SOS-response transcriptional repressor LexA